MSTLTYEDPSYYLDNSSSKSLKKKGRHRKLDTLTYETIREYFVYTQSQAAKKLGVSVSTLKRKFYSLGYENRWPYIRTVTPKKKGMNKRTHEEEEEEVSAEEEEDSYGSEEEVIREPVTRSARKIVSASTPTLTSQHSKKRKVVEYQQEAASEEQVVIQTSPSSRIGFASTSSAAFIPQQISSKPIEQTIVAEEDVEEDEYIPSEEEEEEPIAEEENDDEQEPIVVVGHKESTIDHLNTSNISFSDMSNNYTHPTSSSIIGNNTTTHHHHRLYNEQSQTSNQSQDFGDEIAAASMLFQFASSDKKFSSPRILPPISSLHSTNFMNYHAQPLKKRIPSLGDYRNFNSRTTTNGFNNLPSSNSSSTTIATPIASEGLILPPIKSLISDDQCGIGFNNHQHIVQQHIS